ncbi:ankyrin repeat and SOCS box protein 3 isoform X1 [Caloenas nicobarica]|uniref:ankyrin repeat and SOCS box protein 3 isoform X1 n=2 Tax=Caloenas nicobarica TaxID=187106 RepID=UPI0032B7484D
MSRREPSTSSAARLLKYMHNGLEMLGYQQRRDIRHKRQEKHRMDFTESYDDQCSAVGIAARAGNVDLLKKLMRKRHSLDVPDNRGWMPIHEAAAHRSNECLKMLIRAAPSKDYIHTKTFVGMTPLHLAAYYGSSEGVRILLEAGARPNEITTDETTTLFLAVQSGKADIVKILIGYGANVEGPHTWSGWNSLHQASLEGHTEIMKILLEAGASKECEDDYGITPLFIAAQYGKLECLRLLITFGANVNCQAKDKASPLLIAAQEGHTECVELLLASRADANLYCNEDNWQLPIHAAAEMGHKKILELLIPVTDRICDKGKGKVSPVYSAVYGYKKECLEMLLTKGYSPDAQECLKFNCTSPMCMVFRRGFFDFVDIFLKYGVTLLDSNLICCLPCGKFSLFQRFLKLGCPLPSGGQLLSFIHCSTGAHKEYKEWLPYLLLAGFNPVNLMHRVWIFSMSVDALNFALEFTDWKRLPLVVQQDLLDYGQKTAWTPKSFIPPLSHLCRLGIRSLLSSERLRSDRFIRQLPLPTCLQDYLLYLDVLRVSGVPEAEVYLRQRAQGHPLGSDSSDDDEE